MLEDIRNERLAKKQALADAGKETYPIASQKGVAVEEARERFAALAKKRNTQWIHGRVTAIRAHGGAIFFDLRDGTPLAAPATLQCHLKRDTDESAFQLFLDTVDIGDFVECGGNFFLTKRNEKTLEVKTWNMLAKSLRPLPEKWHGLTDVEERFRRRYLDALMDPEVAARFVLRSQIVREARNFFDALGYLEIETPILQPLYGGASAEPFVTHHNALGTDFYLRIADELYLKRALIAGFPRVYEIAKDFRNEGIDVTHNPEFTMLEFYEAYTDAEGIRARVESLIKHLATQVMKSSELLYEGEKIELGEKFSVETYYGVLSRHALIADPEHAPAKDLALKAAQLGVSFSPEDGRAKLLDGIFKKACRPKLIQPTFLIDYPAEMLPLAKRQQNRPDIVDAFQLYIGGLELGKAFSELNDPIDQRARFEAQEKEKTAGDKEAQSLDEDFLEAMEYGMPPAGGYGVGIDRLVMFFANVKNIREVIFFPTLRPKT